MRAPAFYFQTYIIKNTRNEQRKFVYFKNTTWWCALKLLNKLFTQNVSSIINGLGIQKIIELAENDEIHYWEKTCVFNTELFINLMSSNLNETDIISFMRKKLNGLNIRLAFDSLPITPKEIHIGTDLSYTDYIKGIGIYAFTSKSIKEIKNLNDILNLVKFNKGTKLNGEVLIRRNMEVLGFEMDSIVLNEPLFDFLRKFETPDELVAFLIKNSDRSELIKEELDRLHKEGVLLWKNYKKVIR